ncbi:MAG: hypothetical protein F4085_04905, partial [Acidimicrobiia bacterium]|nr:hypothetical protein [Acidimicrobiia bacterium]
MRRVPNTSAAGAELVPLFRDQLLLCDVKPGETVLGFTDTMSNDAYTTALGAAARVLGAGFFQIVVSGDEEWMRSEAIIDAWKGSDLVVGMLTTGWIYSDAHNAALDAGARTLMIEEPEDVLRRMFPTPEIRRRAEVSKRLMEAGTTLRIQSEAGTDLTVGYEGRPVGIQYGYSDTPGRWDHWPSGQVAVAPLEHSAEGALVLDEADCMINLGRYVTSPIHLEIREGSIVSIEGEADARLAKDYFELPRDKRSYGVSHIGWGYEHRSDWNALGLSLWEGWGLMDVESYYGNM